MAKAKSTPCVDVYEENRKKKMQAEKALRDSTEAEEIGTAVKTFLSTQEFLRQRGIYPGSY